MGQFASFIVTIIANMTPFEVISPKVYVIKISGKNCHGGKNDFKGI